MTENRTELLAWGLLLLLSLIWGSSFILIKKGLLIYSASEVGAIRIVSAYLFLIPLAVKSLKGLDYKQWLLLLTVGMFGSFLPAFLFAKAQTELPSSIAGILNALTPLFTMLVGAVLFSQKTNLRMFSGLVLGFFGCGILILSGSEGKINFNYYGLFVVLATIFYAANLNLIKFKLSDLPARTITSLSLFIVGPVASFHLLVNTEFLTKTVEIEGAYLALGALGLLGILGTAVALILFNQLVKITSPIFTSSVTYIIPLVAVVWGLMDGEQLFFGHYIGMGFIIFGVYLVNKRS